MRKKLCFIALVFMLATTAFAQTEMDFEVGLTADGTGVVIKKYTGRVETVRIPTTIQGMPVREIGESAFSGNTTFTSVFIPQGVTKIGNEAFNGLDAIDRRISNLASVTLPEGLLEIGYRAFNGCPITTITLPQSLTTLGPGAFSNTPIVSVIIPQGITEIPGQLFGGCTFLTAVTFPDSLQTIGASAFESTALTTVTFPASLTTLRGRAFANCTALTDVTFPASITTMERLVFYSCTALTMVTIPETVVRIDFGRYSAYINAFQGCGRLNLASQAALKRVGYTGNF